MEIPKPSSRPVPDFEPNAIQAVYESGQWYRRESLNEELHLFEKGNTQYRQAIDDIVFAIVNNQIEYNPVLRKFDGDKSLVKYNLYEFPIPFYHTPLMNVINLLKVFVKYGDKLSAMVYTDPDDPASRRMGLVKFNGTKVNYISIVVTVTETTTPQELSSVFAHELKHALLIIRNKKLAPAISKDNDKVQLIEDLLKTPDFKNDLNMPTLFPDYYVKTLLPVLSKLQYFCQQTEIEAHLESATYEIQKTMQAFKIGTDKILILLSDPTIANKYSNSLSVLENYRELYVACNTLDNPMAWYQLCRICPDLFDKIAEILFNKDGDPMAYIDFCKKQVRQFLKKLADIVLSL